MDIELVIVHLASATTVLIDTATESRTVNIKDLPSYFSAIPVKIAVFAPALDNLVHHISTLYPMDMSNHGPMYSSIITPSFILKAVFKDFPNAYFLNLDKMAPGYFPDSFPYSASLAPTFRTMFDEWVDAINLSDEALATCTTQASIAAKIFKTNFREDFMLAVDAKEGPRGGIKSRYMKSPLEVFVRQAYYGGRNELYKRTFDSSGPGDVIHHYDVNGLHTSIMMNSYFPVGKGRIWDNVPEAGSMASSIWKEWLDAPDKREAPLKHLFVDATVSQTATPTIEPVLPTHRMTGPNRSLFFPVGTFRGVWYCEELAYALSTGTVTIDEIHGVASFYDEAKILSGIASFFAEKKETASKPLSKFFKGCSNTIPGKFATKESKKLVEMDCPATREYLEARDVTFKTIPCGMIEHESFSMGDMVRPHYGAIVSALARITLHKAITKAGADKYYCDTDSIIQASPMASGDTDAKATGKWKEEATVSRLNILSLKVYGEITDKGTEVLRAAGICKAADIWGVTFSIDELQEAIINDQQGIDSLVGQVEIRPSFVSLLKNSGKPIREVLSYYFRSTKRAGNRLWSEDKMSTVPYTMDQLEIVSSPLEFAPDNFYTGYFNDKGFVLSIKRFGFDYQVGKRRMTLDDVKARYFGILAGEQRAML